MKLWARVVAAGVPEALFWRCTPRELLVLSTEIGKRREREARREDKRAGLVAASILNSVRTKKSQRVWQPGDFFEYTAGVDGKVRRMTPAEAVRFMDAWAGGINQRAGKGGP